LTEQQEGIWPVKPAAKSKIFTSWQSSPTGVTDDDVDDYNNIGAR